AAGARPGIRVPPSTLAAATWSQPPTRARPRPEPVSRTPRQASRAANGLHGRPKATTHAGSIHADLWVRGRANAAPHVSALATASAQADQASAATIGGATSLAEGPAPGRPRTATGSAIA